MFTAGQLVAHMVGDYLTQSHWMATEKTSKSFAAICHVIAYGLPFLFLRPSLPALVVITASHFVVDRWRLARYVVFAKNFLAPRAHWPKWEDCKPTDYPSDAPAWLSVWLLIIADNVIHVVINALALRYL